MIEIVWLESAIDDLVRLKSFLSAHPTSANKIASLIKNHTNKLQTFPLVGKPSEDLEGFYDLFIEFGSSGYNLRYKFFNEKIYIIHVKHSKELAY